MKLDAHGKMIERYIHLTEPQHTNTAPIYVLGRDRVSPLLQLEDQPVKQTASDIQISVDSIMHQVHNRLVIKPPKPTPHIPLPTTPQEIPESSHESQKKEPEVIMVLPNKMTTQPKTNDSSKKSNIKMPNNKNEQKPVMAYNKLNNTIPHLKAKWDQKCQFRRRRGIGSPNESNFTNQMRINEILRQKKILVDMLEEHERLHRDRQNIAREINVMRSYLNEIRNRLDSSINKLNSQPTLCDSYARSVKNDYKRKSAVNTKKTPYQMPKRAKQK